MSNVTNLYDRRVLKELEDLEPLISATAALVDAVEDDDERQHHEASLMQVRRNMEKKKQEVLDRLNGEATSE